MLTSIIDMVKIPAGSFLMGSPEDEEDRQDDEGPQHQVTFAEPFWMGKYPVTQAQWRAVASLPKLERDLDQDVSLFIGDDRPVEQVRWVDAMEFCARLTQATGCLYRLPTEAEWEYACRAGTTTRYSYGDAPDESRMNCWRPRVQSSTTSVGTYPPNDWGLYDMHGNVWEWCLDEYCDSYEGTPTDGSPQLSESEEVDRVMRGSAWDYSPEASRSAFRFWGVPTSPYNAAGFRVVRGASCYTKPEDCRTANRDRLQPTDSDLAVSFRVVTQGDHASKVEAVLGSFDTFTRTSENRWVTKSGVVVAKRGGCFLVGYWGERSFVPFSDLEDRLKVVYQSLATRSRPWSPD